jgi:hypothetical protein
MQVIATKAGFYGGSRRRAGDVFEMNVDPKKLPSWVALGATRAPAKAAPLSGDTKPADAAAAASKKRADADERA